MNIDDPHQLTIENVVNNLRLKHYYWSHSSELVEYSGKCKVFINESLSGQQQWQDFGHEMKHYFLDSCSRAGLSEMFIKYQEMKVDYFAYHFLCCNN